MIGVLNLENVVRILYGLSYRKWTLLVVSISIGVQLKTSSEYVLNPFKNSLTFCNLIETKNSGFILQSHLCEYVWHCHRVERMPATCIRFSFNGIWSVHSLLICSDCYPFTVAALAECPPWPWASVIFGPRLFVWYQVNVASRPLIRERQAQWAAKNNIWFA